MLMTFDANPSHRRIRENILVLIYDDFPAVNSKSEGQHKRTPNISSPLRTLVG